MRTFHEPASRDPRDLRPARHLSTPSAARAPAAPSPATISQLQRSVGNAAVCSALDRSAAPAQPAREVRAVHRRAFTATIEMGAGPTAPDPRGARLTSTDAMPGGEKQMAVSGLPAPSQPAPAPGTAEPAPGGETAAGGPEPAEPAAPAEAAAEQVYLLPDIVIPALEGGLQSTDAVTSWLPTVGHITRGGLALGGAEFGRTDGGDLRVTGISVTAVPLLRRFLVKATIEHHVKWDVRAGVGPSGQVDISSWSSPHITAANYTSVADALTPDTADLGGRPPRAGFWAKDLTEQHEQYHADDMVSHTDPAASLASTWLSAQVAPSVAGVSALLTQVPGRMVTAIIASFIPRAEHRAYGDGVTAYRTRALAIRARGALGGY